MNKGNVVFYLGFLGICAGLLFCVTLFNSLIFSGHSDNKNSVKVILTDTDIQENTNSENAEIIIKDLILKEIEKHKGLQVIINAREGKIIHSNDKIECKHIKCCLCNKDSQIADLIASDALIDKTTKNVFLTGDTTVHFDDITINGCEVYYNYSNQKLATEKQTKYEHPHFSLLAQSSKIDFKKNEIRMSGGVKSEFLNRTTED